MSKGCCRCDHSESKSSGFVFGVIIGAIIGAIIAVIIYKRNQGEVFDILKEKLERFISKIKKTSANIYSEFSQESQKTTSNPSKKTSSTRKTRIIDEPIIESVPFVESDLVDTPKIKKPKTFVRPKK